MDEEKNNEQDPAQKTSQDVQDTVNAVKDGANLAKDVSTGNVVGAIKHGLSLLKNKKTLKIIIASILLPIIIFVSIVASYFAIFDAIGNTIQNIIDVIKDFFKINSDSWDGSIEITDEQVDQVIQGIKDMNIKIEGLRLAGDIERNDNYTKEEREEKEKEAERKYVKKFLETQFITETPHYEPKNTNGNAYGQKTYGKVYLYRTDDAEVVDENTMLYEMSWMSYEKMQEEAAKNNKKGLDAVRRHYSIDEEGKLVIAQWTIIETQVDNGKKQEQIIISLRHIDYKSVISQYTTPVNFLIYLTMVSQNPEFVSAVTEIIKNNTKIDITILDTVTTTVEVETYTCKNWSKGVNEVEKQGSTRKVPYRNSTDEKTVTTTTTTSTVPVPKVTYAKTWFSEQRVTYNRELKEETYPTEDITEPDDEEPLGDTGRWTENKKTSIDRNETMTEYKEGTRGNVEYKGGEKDDPGVTEASYEDKEERRVKDKFNINSETTFVGLMDDSFRIPNSKRYEAAGKINLVDAAEWLFSLLQKDGKLQGLEQVMRYIMQKYTGKDYGVKDLDFNILDIRDFVIISTKMGTVEEVLKSYENDALRRYRNGETGLYGPVEKYVTKDKTQYKMFYTSFDGCLNFSYGIMVRNANGQINNKKVFEDAGIDLEQLLKDYDSGKEVTVNADVLDSIFSEIVKQKKNDIRNAFSKRGEELKEYELDALVCVAYQYGNCGQYIKGDNNIVELYINCYQKGNTEAFRRRARAQTGGGGTDLIFTDDTYRKKANWLLFSEGKYTLADGTEIKAGEDLIGNDAQQDVVNVAKNSAAYGCTQEEGLCQAWVYQVYWHAGVCAEYTTRHCARHAGYEWSVSTDWSQIPLGATVYGYSSSIYGHVGIYIGDGIVAHNVGGISFDDLDYWISKYKGVCWGWNGVDLTGGSYPWIGGLIAKPNH